MSVQFDCGRYVTPLALALLGFVGGCATVPGPEPPGIVSPRTFTTMSELVPQIHSVVRGTVEDIRFDYDDCAGPRTIVQLTAVETLLGDRHDSKLVLRTFGGPLPNGNFVSASELPRYVLGGRYVLFLRNTDWRFSPVIGNLAFREETVVARQVLVDTEGFAVTGVDESGVLTDGPRLMEPVGMHVVGLQSTPEQARASLAPPPARPGESEPCGAQTGRPCGSERGGDGVRRAREWIVASGRFARPPVADGVGPEAVKGAISTNDLVAAVDRWAHAHSVRIGGYYAEGPRIGCWGRTLTQRPR